MLRALLAAMLDDYGDTCSEMSKAIIQLKPEDDIFNSELLALLSPKHLNKSCQFNALEIIAELKLQVMSLWSLSAHQTKDTVTTLVTLYNQPFYWRSHIVQALAAIGAKVPNDSLCLTLKDSAAVNLYFIALTDHALTTRCNAVDALGDLQPKVLCQTVNLMLQDSRLIPMLTERLQKDTYHGVRNSALVALAKLKVKDVLDTCISVLSESQKTTVNTSEPKV